MADSFTRPYIDRDGRIVYLTDADFANRHRTESLRKLTPGEVVIPEVDPMTQIAPNPATTAPSPGGGEVADTAPVDPHIPNPTAEVREREVT
jgi:hypothetical protein